MEEVLGLLNGGGQIPWERSIRGRLHAVQNTLHTADALATALREVRRDRAHAWNVWEKSGLFVCAAVTAGSALYAALVAAGAL